VSNLINIQKHCIYRPKQIFAGEKKQQKQQRKDSNSDKAASVL
jgi:hypothetical protein